MTVLNATRLLTAPRLRSITTGLSRWSRDRLLGTVQIGVSTIVLFGILAIYLLRPGVSLGDANGAGIEPAPVFAEATWAPLLHEAQDIRMLIMAANVERLPGETSSRWSLSVSRLSSEIAAVAADESSVADGARLRTLNGHLRALARFEISDVGAEEVGLVLDALIVDLDELTQLENDVMVALLESANRVAVQALGTRALLIAASALVASVAVLGLGAGAQRLLRARL